MNLLKIKYSNKCSVQVVQKSVTLEEIGLQNFCVFLFWNTINPTHIQVSGILPTYPSLSQHLP